MQQNRYKKILAQNLKSIRKSKGLTTTDLAKILGVSQAKISYIEHSKGVLSATDVAVLSRRLDVPVVEFFHGLNEAEEQSETKELAGHLVHYGAVLLAKPAGVTLKAIPFEEVFARSLGFTEDDRFHKGLCAALIKQADSKEINVDRIFAIIGDNPFLTSKAAEEAQLGLEIIELLKKRKVQIRLRSKEQIRRIALTAEDLHKASNVNRKTHLTSDEISEITDFVQDCFDAKK